MYYVDDKPMLRDYVRDVIEERGESVRAAEREMGLPYGHLNTFLREESLNWAEKRTRLLADYLELDYDDVRRWMERDEARIRRGRVRAKTELAPSGLVLTWWGWLERPLLLPPYKGCVICEMDQQVCRDCVQRGLPLPCERLLERELVPAGMEERWWQLHRERCRV